MLENKRVQKPREFWVSIAYFRASTVFHYFTLMKKYHLQKKQITNLNLQNTGFKK